MSAAQISAFTPTGEEFNIVHAAVPGLVLRLGPTGGKRWLMPQHMAFHICAWEAHRIGDSS
jgi:hypothetical protein